MPGAHREPILYTHTAADGVTTRVVPMDPHPTVPTPIPARGPYVEPDVPERPIRTLALIGLAAGLAVVASAVVVALSSSHTGVATPVAKLPASAAPSLSAPAATPYLPVPSSAPYSTERVATTAPHVAPHLLPSIPPVRSRPPTTSSAATSTATSTATSPTTTTTPSTTNGVLP